MSHALRWWREKKVLRTYVTKIGFYTIERWDNKSFRVYLNNEGTKLYGSEEDCVRAVQRVVNNMPEMA